MKIALLSLDASAVMNMEQVEKLMRAAAGCGASLALLPELSYGGYGIDERELGRFGFEDGLSIFLSMAKRCGIAIGFGAGKRLENGKYFNRYAIVSASGDVLAEYDKIHIFSFGGEQEVFETGDHLATFELDGLMFGVSICYDLRFAEIFSAYSRECDVVICPAAWPKKRLSHYKLLLKARAVENMLTMLGINWRGMSPRGIEYAESSCAVTPKGHFAKAVFSDNGIDIYEVSKRGYCATMPNTVSDKRFDLYPKLYTRKNSK